MNLPSVFLTLICLAGLATAQADEPRHDLPDWPRLSRWETFSRIQAMPHAQRVSAVRSMLESRYWSVRSRGIESAARFWLTDVIPELEKATSVARSGRRRFEDSLATALRRLRLYAPFAVPAPDPGPASSEDLEIPDVFRELPVEIELQTQAGRPLAHARLFAFSHDYDLTLPAYGFVRSDSEGLVTMSLPPGRYTFVAASASDSEQPTVLCMPDVQIASGRRIRMRADRHIRWSLANTADPVRSARMFSVRVRGYPFKSFRFPGLAPGPIATSSGAELEATLTGRRESGWCFLRSASRGNALEFDARNLVPIAWHSKDRRIRSAELELRIGDDPINTASFQLARDDRVWVPPTRFDLSYSYYRPDTGMLRFRRRPWPGGPLTLELGGPLRPVVWHKSYERRYGIDGPMTSFQLFVVDSQGQCLDNTAHVELRVSRGDKRWKLLHLVGGLATIPEYVGDTNELRYEFRSRLPLGNRRVLGISATRFESRHYELFAPSVLDREARTLLAAAERLYAPLRAISLGDPTWTKGQISIHSHMPGGVRAYSSVNGRSNFSVEDLMRCSSVRDAIAETPLLHEHLHTVGYSHKDYMDIAGFRVRRALDHEGHEWMALGQDDRASTWLTYLKTGESNRRARRALPYLLFRLHGERLFDGYLHATAERNALQAAGYSEVEADCAMFSRLAKRDLSNLFRTVYTNLDPKRAAAAMNTHVEPKATAAGSFELGPIRVALSYDAEQAEDLVRRTERRIERLPAHRAKIRQYLRLAKVLQETGRVSERNSCLRNALRAARLVNSTVFRRARAQAIGVVLGNPLQVGWL